MRDEIDRCESCGRTAYVGYPLVNKAALEDGELRKAPMVHPGGCPAKTVVIWYDEEEGQKERSDSGPA